jgi:Rieske Fe-S protein
MSDTTRRAVLAGAAGVSAAALLAACGDSSGDKGTGAGQGNATTGAPDAGSGSLAKKSEIPVGGGKVIDSQKIVITQPTAGEFKAFSAICTHQGCTVGSVQDGTINCPCHGSKYAIADGSVKTGPATRPLPPKTISVLGDDILLS